MGISIHFFINQSKGRIKVGDRLINTRTGVNTSIGRLVKLHAGEMEDVTECFAGDIFATFGVDCASGDTFAANSLKNLSMESMHVPEPVMSLSISPKNQKNEKQFQAGLLRFVKEDPSFRFAFDEEAGEWQISGMGELHLEIYAQRMESEYDCPVVLGQPKVAFRETIVNELNYEYTHKKQSGGRGQYGKAWGTARPNPDDPFSNDIRDLVTGQNLPRQYIKPLKQGFEKQLAKGPLIGMPIVGIQIDIKDGQCHPVDSSEASFDFCGQGCIQDIYYNSEKSILEPIMNVEVSYPAEFDSLVIPLLMENHFDIETTETDYLYKTVHGKCGLNDMFGFTAKIRGSTEGKGEFSMEFSHYDHCRDDVQEDLIIKYQNRMREKKAAGKKTQQRKK